MPNLSSRFITSIRQWDWPLLLVWSCLLLLPVGRSVELPTAIMAISSGVLWYRGRIHPVTDRYRIFTLAFFLVWIPMAISVPDAVIPAEALRVTGFYLRFYFAGLFIVWAVDTVERRHLLLRLTAWLLLFWIFDALVQFTFGFDLFGQAYPIEHLSGPFGRKLKLGLVLTTLSPFLFNWCREKLPPWVFPLVAAMVIFIILGTGSRGSWVMLSIILLIYFIAFLRSYREAAPLILVVTLTSVIGISWLSYSYSTSIAARVDRTLLLFSGDIELVDQALSYRLPIWSHALEIIRDNPVNGVGARNFRDAFPAYLLPGEKTHMVDGTAYHPHQIVLEFTAEAGFIGLAGLLGLYFLLIRTWRRASLQQRQLALPAGIGLLAWLFPLNTSVALFSSFWGQVIWWLIAIYFALASLPGEPERR